MKIVKVRQRKKINEGLGFLNPFNDDEDENIQTTHDFNIFDSKKGITSISNVGLWNPNVKNKIAVRNERVYSNTYFCSGDIIEECPIKLLSHDDLYSKTIRDCAFPIDCGNDVYGMPLGYGIFYRNSADTGLSANVDYEYDEKNNSLIFKAIKDIKKGTELILLADEKDFANTLRADQFRYDNDFDLVEKIKKYKFV